MSLIPKRIVAQNLTCVVVALLLIGCSSKSAAPIVTPALTPTNVPQSTPSPLPTATAPPAPTPGIGSTLVREADGAVMVYVPAGTFLMGSDPVHDPNARDDEQPQHEVTLSAFWIDRTEVTNAQYAACVQAKVCTTSDSAGDPRFNGADQPVVNIGWADARAYCQWVGADLPTEAQWEKAARGTDGQLYPWPDPTPITCELAQYKECGMRVVSVGTTKGTSPYGALDMAGNAREWTLDWYDDGYYAHTVSVQDPTGPASGKRRVIKGGSWSNGAPNLRSAYRYRYEPDVRNMYVGFRCALGAASP